MSTDRLTRRSARIVRLAALTLRFEALLTAFWPALTLIGFFLVLALFGIPTALPSWAHLALLILFGTGLAALVVRGARGHAKPAPGAALRRVERDSALQHRPFQALADRPAGGDDPVAGSLWRLHVESRRREIGSLRVAPPQTRLAERDPRALRVLVLIALAVGLVIAGPRSGPLILAALTPSLGTAATETPVEAWIKPPAYTGLPPILLGSDRRTVRVPTGSVLEAHVTGGSRTPRLSVAGAREEFKAVDGGGFAASRTLTLPGDLAVTRGWSTLARWTIEIIPDEPPVVELLAEPAAMVSGALRIDYHATDDYGVASVALRIRQSPDSRPIKAEPIDVALSSGRSEKDMHGVGFQDLTAHPWAGTTVLAHLVATDEDGQSGESAEVELTLPERSFTDPAARAVVAMRKHIILEDAPRGQVAMGLSGLLMNPEAFHGDYAVYLALATALDELRDSDADDDRTADIEDLMWSAAVRIEDGDRPEAEKALRAAEDALEKALKDPSTPASEIARLTQTLKEAMNRDLEAMIRKMREQQGQDGQSQTGEGAPDAQSIDRKDLDSQIDKMAQLAETGSRDAAQEMLDYIKNLLENLRTGTTSDKAHQQGMKALKDLKDLAQKQRDMENADGADAAQKQEALRQSLGDTARDIGESLGDIPQSLSGADRAMRNAAKALQRGAKGGAQADQEDAAGQLDQAIQSLSDQLSQQGMSERKGDGQGSRDPLGRARPDMGRDVKVPTDREMQRSRAILDELRRRAGEHERPRFELDYLKRLLQDF